MCCGSKRSAWRAASVQSVPQRPAAPVDKAPVSPVGGRRSFREVLLRYRESAPIRVWGPVTGLPYDFSAAEPVQAVEARDAAALARSEAFQPAEA